MGKILLVMVSIILLGIGSLIVKSNKMNGGFYVQSAQGFVIDKNYYGHNSRSTSQVYFCRIGYRVEDQVYQITGTCPFKKPGDNVEVLYDPENPKQGYEDNSEFGYYFLIGGLTFTGITILSVLYSRNKKLKEG